MTRSEDTANSDVVDVGVIGVGSMGQHHARIYDRLLDTRLVGIHDEDEEKSRSVATEYGASSMGLVELLDAVDAVSIAVPTPFHFDVASTCLERGVDVLVEKPLVNEVDKGRELIRRADERDLRLQVGHIERFNPAVVALDDILADKNVLALDANRLGPPLDREVGDDVVYDLMIHDIDIALSLLDAEPVSVSASATSDEQYANASIEFNNEVVANLTASRVTQKKIRTLDITAEKCLISLDFIEQTVDIHRRSVPEYINHDGKIRYQHESLIEQPMVPNTEPLRNELSSFIDAVATGSDPKVTGRDGLRAIELAQQVVNRCDDGNDQFAQRAGQQ